MRLLSYNIQYGFGQDGVYDLSRAAARAKAVRGGSMPPRTAPSAGSGILG